LAGNPLFLREDSRKMPYLAIKRNTGLIILMLVLMFTLHRCAEDDSSLPATAGWTSLDPTAIPLRLRTIQVNRGNLVKNPSFELGRIINIDSNTVSNNISGWKWVGTHVDWVSDAHTGMYAVKIRRENADETISQGEGIISDFIRIIPGNYELTFWIRLRDIHSYQERLGTRIDDAIDIRVLYYDRNRLLISGKTFNARRNTNIDQSFKALPFSGFWHIDSLDWSHVMGRTTNDYLTEGDVPDEAKFVKIFFGLKGTGTMWIDDVDFRYSTYNFTSLEKSEHFFDTTFTAVEMLVPAPKRGVVMEPLIYHFPGTDSLPYPVVVIPQHASRPTMTAANLLKSRLDQLFERLYGSGDGSWVRIVSEVPEQDLEAGGLIFSFGKEYLSDGVQADSLLAALKGLQQGYIIQPDALSPNLVHLIGSDPDGDYFAVVTAVQLLDQSQFIYHQARILDYPDIPERAFLVSPVAAASGEMADRGILSGMLMLKMNRGYLDYYRARDMWERTGTAYLRGLNEISREAGRLGVLQLAHMVNPYAFLPASTRLDSLEPGLRNSWMHSSVASLIKLQSRIRAGLEAGASTLVLCTHDHLPYTGGYPLHFTLYAQRDIDAYLDLQQAHLDLIRAVTGTPGVGKSLKLEFIAPWYANEEVDQSRGQAECYLKEMADRMPENVGLLWSGPARKSHAVDEADLHRYGKLTGSVPVLWDNSLNALPELLNDTSLSTELSLKLRTLNLFEPYRVKFTGSPLPGGHVEKIIINSNTDSEIMKIRMATAADYMWNTRTYNPDFSLWKVLVSRFGREAGMNLYHFNESYMTLIGSLNAFKDDAGNQRYTRQISVQLEVMQETLTILEGLIPDQSRFLNELKHLKLDLEQRFEKEVEVVSSPAMAVQDDI
jgi:hypothetical protein